MHKNVKLMILFQFLVEFRLYIAILVIYFAKITGSYTLAMSILSIVMVSAALLEVPTGVFSDMIGRKNTMTLGALASILFVLFYAIGDNYWLLTIGAIFEGFSRALWSGNNDALLYESLAEKNNQDKFGEYSGKSQSAGQAALAICSLLGGIIATISFPLVMWLTIIPQVIAFIISLRIIEPKIRSNKSSNVYIHIKESLKQFRYNYKLKLVSLTSILRFAFGETAFQFRPVFINMIWPIWAVGLAHTLSFIGGSISYYFSGAVIKRFTALKVLAGEIIANRSLNIIALVFPTIISPVLMSMTSLIYGVGQVATDTLIQKEFTHEQRATLGSINSLIASLAFAVVSVTIGLFADRIGVINILLIIHLVLFLPLWFYWKIFKHDKKMNLYTPGV